MRKKTEAFEDGFDSGGYYRRGVAALLKSCGREVALVCPDMDTLRWAWERFANDCDLDLAGVIHVRIYKDTPSKEE